MKQKEAFIPVITSLLDNDHPFPPKYLSRLSDLTKSEGDQLAKIWIQIDADRRIDLVKDLYELFQSDYTQNFESVGHIAIKDNSEIVRAAGIMLFSESIDNNIIPTLIKIGTRDESPLVRAAVADVLGFYIVQCELEHLPQRLKPLMVNFLKNLYIKEKEDFIRQCALQSLSPVEDDHIHRWIQEAFCQDEEDWQVAALTSMGNSGDDARWETSVISKLTDPSLAIQFAAISSSGSLQLQSAKPILIDLLENQEELDHDIYLEALTAIAAIGGEGTKELLKEYMSKASTEEDADFIEDLLVIDDMDWDMDDETSENASIDSDDDEFDFDLDEIEDDDEVDDDDDTDYDRRK